MKFKDYKYIRPNYELVKSEFKQILSEIENSLTFEQLINNINKINIIRDNFTSMKNLSGLRYSIDTNDKYYIEENDYFDKYWPFYKELNVNFYKVLLNSKFLSQLKDKYGEQFFRLAEKSLKSFDPIIMQELQEENTLVSEYIKLRSSAKIWYDGAYRTLSQLGKYTQLEDRLVRQSASKAYNDFFEENQEKFDNIYDKLVKLRDRKAKKLGYKNYVELGYIEMNRTDYNAEMVENFRKQVLEFIVPVATELKIRQQKRIGIDNMQYYDEKLKFLNGNAIPKGTTDEIINNGMEMFRELSEETGEFFDFIMEHELLDVLSREGKEGGGFCSYIINYKSPFIFTNFNGTSDDVKIFTHEAGHAFQKYMSRNIEMLESTSATLESAEIHSMSMEFFTWLYMSRFFKEDTDKYKFAHLAHAIEFIPYGVVVDAFQHKVYENPKATPMERRTMWRELERQYLPTRKYDDSLFLDSGTWWYKQGHLFFRPFYYIDYTLAQVCALQFWKRMNEDKKSAWNDYVNICRIGGTKSFLDIVKEANLISPFEDGCIESIIYDIKNYLDGVDDRKL